MKKIYVMFLSIAILVGTRGFGTAMADDGSKFAITVQAVKAGLKQKNRFLIVDIRPQKEYASLHIPGSINIALYSLRTKTFLKSKNMVIVDNGFNDRRLVPVCEELKQKGFKPLILAGGLTSWQHHHEKLEGNRQIQTHFNLIEATRLFESQGTTKPILIYTQDKIPDSLSSLLTDIKKIPILSDTNHAIRILKKSITHKQAKDPFGSVVILTKDGQDYRKIENKLAGHSIEPVFYLKGGLVAYKQFTQTRLRLQKSLHHKPKNTQGCSKCQAGLN